MDTSLQSLDQIRASALDMAVRFGPKVLVAILIMAAGYAVGRWVGRGLERLLLRLNLEAPVRSLLRRIAQLCVLGIFAIMALQNLGIELLPLIAGLGVAGAGIALAMQGLLGNLVAGLSIIFTRPFHVGDYISIADEEGEVVDISLFSTTLGHTDLSRVVIPNRKIVGEILHNYGQIRRLAISVGVSYRTDVNAALALIGAILAANSRVLKDPAPLFGVTRLSEASITISISPWVNVPDHDPAIKELNKSILDVFSANSIALALPLYEVRMLGSAPAPAMSPA